MTIWTQIQGGHHVATEQRWGDASTSGGRPRTAGNHYKPGAKDGFFPRAFQESMAQLTPWFWASSLQNCETMNFCCLKPSKFAVICYSRLRQLPQNVESSLLQSKKPSWNMGSTNRTHTTKDCWGKAAILPVWSRGGEQPLWTVTPEGQNYRVEQWNCKATEAALSMWLMTYFSPPQRGLFNHLIKFTFLSLPH